MRKVKLNLDGLVVETFAAGDSGPAERGTVKAHATAVGQATCPYTCSHEIACYYTRGCVE
ncbi:MAG TPA: hypothetical protein VFJ16_29690 [Longimicrobium sp.]|nr:hypothetical protein [Longimicrobium sp.]